MKARIFTKKCSRRKFCCEFFNQISEHFRDFSTTIKPITDLGIIGKIFTFCRTWVYRMPILVKGDDVRSQSWPVSPSQALWVKHIPRLFYCSHICCSGFPLKLSF